MEVNNHIGPPAMSFIEAHENLILWKVLLPNLQCLEIVAAQHLVWTIDKFLEAGKITSPFEYSGPNQTGFVTRPGLSGYAATGESSVLVPIAAHAQRRPRSA
jgi:hypothetical protein